MREGTKRRLAALGLTVVAGLPLAKARAADVPAAPQSPEPTYEQLQLLAIAPQNGPFVVDVGTAENGFARPFTVNTVEEGVKDAEAALKKQDIHGHILYQISDKSQSDPVAVLDGECTPRGCTANLDHGHDIAKFWKSDAEMKAAVEASRLTIMRLALTPN